MACPSSCRPTAAAWKTARRAERLAPGSADGGLVGAAVALVVLPADRDLVAGLGALDRELQERVLGHRRAPLGRHHRLAVVAGGDFLDEPGRDRLAGSVLALAGL